MVLYQYRYPNKEYLLQVLNEECREMPLYVAPIISIHKSRLNKDGRSMFAEKTFQKGDHISVYMGSNYKYETDTSCYQLDFG